MQIRYKIWLDNGGKAFGEGPYQLLARVAAVGSLSKAAADMHMSYNKAWRLMKAMEERLGFPLLACRAGGPDGGGSEITDEGAELVRRYAAFREEAEGLLQEAFARHFPDESRARIP